jgi:excisionase family DNA binding protein
MSKPERITIERAIEIIGLPVRTVQGMAQSGEIPGAIKFGRRWTFNELKLRRYVEQKERERWRGSEKHRLECSGAATSSGQNFKSKAYRSGKPSEQTIRSLLKIV